MSEFMTNDEFREYLKLALSCDCKACLLMKDRTKRVVTEMLSTKVTDGLSKENEK